MMNFHISHNTFSWLKNNDTITLKDIVKLENCSFEKAYDIMIFLLDNKIIEDCQNGNFKVIVSCNEINRLKFNQINIGEEFSENYMKHTADRLPHKSIEFLTYLQKNPGVTLTELKDILVDDDFIMLDRLSRFHLIICENGRYFSIVPQTNIDMLEALFNAKKEEKQNRSLTKNGKMSARFLNDDDDEDLECEEDDDDIFEDVDDDEEDLEYEDEDEDDIFEDVDDDGDDDEEENEEEDEDDDFDLDEAFEREKRNLRIATRRFNKMKVAKEVFDMSDQFDEDALNKEFNEKLEAFIYDSTEAFIPMNITLDDAPYQIMKNATEIFNPDSLIDFFNGEIEKVEIFKNDEFSINTELSKFELILPEGNINLHMYVPISLSLSKENLDKLLNSTDELNFNCNIIIDD